jgi:hypothetical protein
MAHTGEYCLLMIIITLFTPAAAMPDTVLLDASVKGVYEDNINPLLSGAHRPFPAAPHEKSIAAGARFDGISPVDSVEKGTGTADFYTVLSTAGGVGALVGPEMEVSLKAELMRYQFVKFAELNATTIGLHARLIKQFSDIHSAGFGFLTYRTEFQADAFEGSGFSATFNLQQQPASRFWLNESFKSERHGADADLAGFEGNSVALQAGYRFSSVSEASVSYGFHRRKFHNGVQLAVHLFAVAGTRELIRHVSLVGSFERQDYRSFPSHDRAADHILTIGIAFSN